MSRASLSPYASQRVYVRGRVQRHGQVMGNGEPTVCLEHVEIEPPDASPLLFDHIWLRKGLTTEIESRLRDGEWFSFTARVWKYQRVSTGTEEYGLAFPEEVRSSYSS